MNFNHLLIFHKVAEKKHFTKAAEELYISQPAVSKQIHELEKSLKQTLFTRVGSRIQLTDAGNVLFDYTKRIFALAKEAEMALEEFNGLERGRLAISASTTIGTYLLPELLGHYKTRYPQIELAVMVANTELVQEEVIAGRAEVGLIEGHVTHAELEQQIWLQDILVPIMAPEQAKAFAQGITVEQFMALQLPLIGRERGSGTRIIIEQALATRQLALPQPIMELGSPEAIKHAVAAGLGFAFVSEHIIQLEETAHRLQRIHFHDFKIYRPLSLVFPKQRKFSRATQAFLTLLNEEYR